MESIIASAMKYGAPAAAATQVEKENDFEDFGEPKIIIVGCGGAGNNTINRLHKLGVKGAETIAINTDKVHLDIIEADKKLLIGKSITRGLGAGGYPEVAERCAEMAQGAIEELLEGADLVFITAGMGGGTGTGTAPTVAKIAKKKGAIVIGMVSTPFNVERARLVKGEDGLNKLRGEADTVIVLDNNRLLDLVPTLPVEQAFAVMDHLISEVVKGITESITVPSLINLDFNDVRAILQSGGTSTVFYGENSDDDPDQVVADTLDNPLLDVDHRGARGALVHISAGPSLRLRTAHEVVEGLTAEMRPDANVIFGVRIDRKYDGIIRVLSIMTGVRSRLLESVAQSVSLQDEESPSSTRALPLNPSFFLRKP